MKRIKPYLIPFFIMIAVVIIVLTQFKRIAAFFNKLFSAAEAQPKEVLDETFSTIDDFDAKRIAELLWSSMNLPFDTKESVIYDSLKDLTKADFAKVYNKFGQRPYIEWIGSGTDGVFGVKYDLWAWLNYELNDSELRKLRGLNPSIFP